MKAKVLLMSALIMPFCFWGCGSDDDEELLNNKNISLYVGESITLEYTGKSCTWSSDNSLIADVDDGVVTAKHVGTTKIHANKTSCIVTVKSKINSYPEPYTEWGSSMSKVKNNMSSFSLNSQDATSLRYAGKGKVSGYIYLFENGGLKTSAMVVDLFNSIELADFLMDRYCILSYERKSSTELEALFISVDGKIAVGLFVKTSGCTVVYFNAEKES